jgi:hypothetical protein
VAAVLLLVFVGLWAGGVLKAKTKDGVIVLENLPQDADVFVDGAKVTVAWGKDGKTAEITVTPGTPYIEAKHGETTVIGEKVEIADGGRKVLTARLEPIPRKPGVDDTRREPPPEPAERDRFVPLLNGRDLTGWHVIRGEADDWKVEQGVLSFTSTDLGHRSFLVSDKEYTDYSVRFEFQADDKAYAGFTIRSKPGRQANDASGGQIGISADKRAGRFVWARFDYLSPNPKPQLQPPENWNRMEIRLYGRRLRVLVNGTQVQNLNLDQIPDRPVAQPYLKRSQGTVEFTRIEGTVRLRNLEWCDLNNTPPPTDPVSPAKIVTQPHGKQAVSLGRGEWSREGDELVQAESNSPVCLIFGDVEWTDYDFSCEAMRVTGPNGFVIIFRAPDKFNWEGFAVGTWNNQRHGWTSLRENVGTGLKQSRNAGVNANEWHKVRVGVRGQRCQCFLDEELLFDFTDQMQARGAVGFRTWATSARFRNIKVTAPDGKVLWEGVPELDTLENPADQRDKRKQ